jgi:hypothetical protein
MMTKKSILICLAVIVIFGCDEMDKLLTFRINDRTSITVESNASPIALPIQIPTPDVTSNSQQQYENNNTAASLVKDVKLEQLKLTITDPATKTFSFLKTIRIFISSDQSNELELASAENIAANASIVDLIPTKEKLDTYLKASSYNLRTEVTTDETLTESVDIQVDLKFVVTANTY